MIPPDILKTGENPEPSFSAQLITRTAAEPVRGSQPFLHSFDEILPFHWIQEMEAVLSVGFSANIIAKLACALSEASHEQLVLEKYLMGLCWFFLIHELYYFLLKNKALHSEKLLQVKYLGSTQNLLWTRSDLRQDI